MIDKKWRGHISPVLLIAATAAALYSAYRLPQAYLPIPEQAVMTVHTGFPSISASEVDEKISAPIEERVSRIEDVVYTYSVSRNDGSEVHIVYSTGTDRVGAGIELRKILEPLANSLPRGIEGPFVYERSEQDMPIWAAAFPVDEKGTAFHFSERAEGLSSLLRIEKPTQPRAEFGIALDKRAFLQGELGPVETISTISRRTEGALFSYGRLLISYRRHRNLSGLLPFEGAAALPLSEYSALKTVNRPPSRIERINGEASLFVTAYNDGGEKSVQLCRELEELRGEYPASKTLLNRGRLIGEKMEELMFHVGIGIVLIAALLLFSNRASSPLPVLITVSAALLSISLVLHVTGGSLNMVSISGIAVSIGLSIDASVIAYETVELHGIAAFKRHSLRPILLSTISTVAVFLPLPLFPAEIRSRYSPLATVVVPALIFSTVYTLFLLPSLMDGRRDLLRDELRKHRSIRRILSKTAPFRGYPRASASLLVLLLAAALSVSFFLSFRPFPRLPTQTSILRYEFPPGTVASAVEKALVPTEKFLLESGMDTRVGARDEQGSLFLTHSDPVLRKRVLKEAEERFGTSQYGGKLFVEAEEGDKARGEVSVLFFGHSFSSAAEEARKGSLKIREELPEADIALNFKGPADSYRIQLDSSSIRRSGRDPAKAAADLFWSFASAPFERVVSDGREYALTLEIESSEGKLFTPLREDPRLWGENFLSVEKIDSYTTVFRRSGVPATGLTVGHREMDRVSLARELENHFPQALVAPELEEERNLKGGSFFFLFSAVLTLAVLLYAYFGSFPATCATLLQIPLSYTAPLIILLLLDIPLSIPTLSGFLLLTGVSVNNGIVLFAGGERETGETSAKGIGNPASAFAMKEHPLRLSSLSTAAGVVPMALTGFGDGGLLAPLSIVIAAGTMGSYLLLYVQTGILLAYNDRGGTKTQKSLLPGRCAHPYLEKSRLCRTMGIWK